ncbi:hypothetical protein AB0K14_25580 [Actinosynnema sp. NPDC050801]|uniref:hypothetical protein n=1 Tax=unclassified Actinosynnema TaxID=2637065 RepID=UPI0033E52945
MVALIVVFVVVAIVQGVIGVEARAWWAWVVAAACVVVAVILWVGEPPAVRRRRLRWGADG